MRRFIYFGLFLLAVISIFFLTKAASVQETSEFSPNLVSSEILPEGYLRADGSIILEFPRDFGPHPEYQTEWWYYTGNLQTTDGHRFGYQLTFFRRGLLPPQEWVERDSLWGANQVYMAHFALSDIAANEHHAFERFARGAAGLAGANAEPYQVWLEDWQVVEIGTNQYQISASQDDIQLFLSLSDTTGPILHGKQGYSQKGPEPGNASYYFSQTRLVTLGSIQVQDTHYEVQGLSWMDHEFSTSALSPGQVGWDWFSLQLDDGSELMVFQIRREDGSIDPYSSGTWVTSSRDTRALKLDEFKIQVLDTWRSPHTEALYPAEWTVQVSSLDLSLKIKPSMPDQEMDLSYAYWEGAVEITGTFEGESVSGSGYVEMTGYTDSMEGEF